MRRWWRRSGRSTPHPIAPTVSPESLRACAAGARPVKHERVRRVMRLHGIVGVHKPRRVRTTIPAEEHPPLPDLVGRLLNPNQDIAWCRDITLRLDRDRLALATST
jgi:transposase InsO family protein